MTTPRSIRFEPETLRLLQRYAARHPGMSISSAANYLVDEALRMERFPGIFFRNGEAGRRAVLAVGPDVWEMIQIIEEFRAGEPDLSNDEIIDAAAKFTGRPDKWVRLAIDYYSAYPGEIDRAIAENREILHEAEEAERVRQKLLS